MFKLIVFIIMIALLIIIFPETAIGVVVEIFNVGSSTILNIAPMFFDFVGPLFRALFSTRYLSSLLFFFIFCNLTFMFVYFLKGQAKSGFSDGLKEEDEEYDFEDDEYYEDYFEPEEVSYNYYRADSTQGTYKKGVKTKIYHNTGQINKITGKKRNMKRELILTKDVVNDTDKVHK